MGEKNGGVFTRAPEESDRGPEGRTTNQSGQEINAGLEMAEIPDSFFKPRVSVISVREG